MAPRLSDYKTDVHNDWCPGCGDFGIVNALQMALAEMGITRDKAVIFSGIAALGRRPILSTHTVSTLCMAGFSHLHRGENLQTRS